MAVLESSRAELFLAIAGRIVREVAAFDDTARTAFLEPVQKTLASRSPSMRRQFALFLSILRWSPILRYGRSFESLPTEQQDAVLSWYFRSPLAILRKGFWGLKTLVFLGYYGRPDVGESIAYRPQRDGNARLHD
ncbi:MAG: gluconate 2-dehydrogenase subunit 3 family protein [bacterium]|nr:gluconate 2-dehydrogenase subunit 3 family protein [bacterium]